MLFVLEQCWLRRQSCIKLRLEFLSWKPSETVMVQSKPFHLSSIECGDHRHCSFGFPYLRQSGLVYARSVVTCLFSLIVALLENQQEMLEFEVNVM